MNRLSIIFQPYGEHLPQGAGVPLFISTKENTLLKNKEIETIVNTVDGLGQWSSVCVASNYDGSDMRIFCFALNDGNVYDYEVNIEASTFQSFVKQVIEKAEAFNPEAELYRHLDDHKLNFDEIVDEIMRADEAFGRLADRFRRLLRLGEHLPQGAGVPPFYYKGERYVRHQLTLTIVNASSWTIKITAMTRLRKRQRLSVFVF